MLFQKAKRAIWSNKKAYLACVFLIATGIIMFTAMSIAVDGLESSMLGFYDSYRLADVFAKVEGMPLSYAERLLELEGVAAVQARYVQEMRVEVAGSEDLITLRIIAIDPMEEGRLNDILVTGEAPSADRDIIVNPTFFKAHGLEYGDDITVIYGGKEYSYTLCGTAISPEYAYITKNMTQMLPDETGFGIAYITESSMTQLTGMAGLSNDVTVKLEEGVTFEDVKVLLEDELARFGLKELLGKEDLPSYAFLDLEVTGIRSVSTSMPMMFVMIAMVVLYLMMKRVIEQERTQIGTMKAFGYSGRQIVFHYLLYGAVTGVCGGLAGWIIGYAMSGVYLQLFLQFFMLPQLSANVSPWLAIAALLMAVGGGVLGAFAGAYKALTLEPAEAMRPESPKPVKHDMVGNMGWLNYVLTSRGRMALRSMGRSPLRSGFVTVGIMFSFGILCMGGSMTGLIDKMIYSQFADIQLYQVKLTLERPAAYNSAVESVYGIEGVTKAEGLMELPAELSNKNLKEGIMLTGIESDSTLYRICDTNTGEAYRPPEGGVILSNAIADKLRAGAGDVITIASPMLDEEIEVPVVRVIEQNLGSGCYIELGTLCDLFDLPLTATAVMLDTDDLAYLKDYLKGSDNIAAIDDKDGTLNKYRTMMGMYESIYSVIQLMGVLVGFAIIYNTTTISLSERKREYATLRVMGLTVKEVAEIMSFEYALLGTAGVILGIPFTLSLNQGMNGIMDTSLFTMPSTLPFQAYITGVAGVVIAIALSGASARKKIKTFDMVEVLKERE